MGTWGISILESDEAGDLLDPLLARIPRRVEKLLRSPLDPHTSDWQDTQIRTAALLLEAVGYVELYPSETVNQLYDHLELAVHRLRELQMCKEAVSRWTRADQKKYREELKRQECALILRKMLPHFPGTESYNKDVADANRSSEKRSAKKTSKRRSRA